MIKSPSEIAIRASGLDVAGTKAATEAGCCVMCGFPYQKGDRVTVFVPTDSFTDYPLLRRPDATHLCKWCDTAWDNHFTQTWLRTVISSEGIFQAASNDHRAYFLLNPPEGEWLFVQGQQQQQHIVWRAPVNLSREVFQIQFGDTVLTVRRERLIEGLAAAQELAAFLNGCREGKRRGAPAKSPFIELNRDLTELSQGLLRTDLLRHARGDARATKLIALIQTLTAGEIWGLSSVLYAPNPHKPSPVATPNLKELAA